MVRKVANALDRRTGPISTSIIVAIGLMCAAWLGMQWYQAQLVPTKLMGIISIEAAPPGGVAKMTVRVDRSVSVALGCDVRSYKFMVDRRGGSQVFSGVADLPARLIANRNNIDPEILTIPIFVPAEMLPGSGIAYVYGHHTCNAWQRLFGPKIVAYEIPLTILES